MNRPLKFTLIEMIAVITIIVLLMGIAIPAFENSATGPKVNQATTQIKLSLEQAALDAIISGRFVAVIFPLPTNLSGNIGNWGEAQDRLRDYYFTSYRLAYVKKNNNIYTFDEWLGPWRILPPGTALLSWQDQIENNLQGIFPSNGQPQTSQAYRLPAIEVKDILIELKSGGNKITFDTKSAVVFAPYGGTVAPALLTVAQATISRDNDRYRFFYQDRDGDSAANYRSLWINSFTGGVRYL